MKQFFVLFITLLNVSLVCSQGVKRRTTTINGSVSRDTILNDSILFYNGPIPDRYFTSKAITSKLSKGSFIMPYVSSFPQMMRVLFSSDQDVLASRSGIYYIDQTTRNVKADYLCEECIEIDGDTFKEYKTQFIPYFLSSMHIKYNEQVHFEKYRYSQKALYDSLLFSYVNKFPNSYVALWQLIDRFYMLGHSKLREEILGQFSKKIKCQKLWKYIDSDIRLSLIKEHKPFPLITLGNIKLDRQVLSIPKGKVILIDFWFSRCKPCLEDIPQLKNLYLKYQARGFEIIGISIDRVENITLWRNRIKEYQLTWDQYLDLNGTTAAKLMVQKYPTFMLISESGDIISKDMSLKDVAKYLSMKFHDRQILDSPISIIGY